MRTAEAKCLTSPRARPSLSSAAGERIGDEPRALHLFDKVFRGGTGIASLRRAMA